MVRLSAPSLPSSLLRALGLSVFELAILATFSKYIVPLRDGEEKKVAVSRNRWRAAFRCCIHIIPVVPSLALAYLNIYGYYIGGELAGPPGEDSARFGGLQFAAKMHELAINASIAAMIYSWIRYELTAGLGLPLGALIAGQRFTELSYLWSLDFWGVILSNAIGYSWWRKVYMVVIIVTAIFLAATAAPSSAIAILPRLGMWPCCGTSFWINVSKETLWPTELNASHTGGQACLGVDATQNTSCPSGSYSTLLSYGPFLTDRSLNNVPPGMIMMYGDKRIRAMNSTWQIGRNPSAVSAATSPMAVLVDSLGLADWGLVAARYSFYRGQTRYWFQRAFLTQVNALQPVTRVKCSGLYSRMPNDTSDLTFLDQEGSAVLVRGSGNSEVWAETTSLNESGLAFPRLYWIELPQNLFVNSTMGALVVLPTSTDGASISYTTCNIDSRWADGTTFSCGPGIYCGTPKGLDVYALGHTFRNWMWPVIRSDIDWVKALNPPVTYAGYNTTTFAAIAHSAGLSSTLDLSYPLVVEGILAMMFTDALARFGSTATLQGTLKGAGPNVGFNMPNDGEWVDEWMNHGDAFEVDVQESRNWASLTMATLVNGYAYSFEGIAIKLAIAVLMLHATLALAHTIYELTSGLSSSSWDSVAELIALALNSTPTMALQNTCAGISRISTTKTPVRIVATEDDHLELDFTGTNAEYEMVSGGADTGSQSLRRRNVVPFQPNKCYGTVRGGGETRSQC